MSNLNEHATLAMAHMHIAMAKGSNKLLPEEIDTLNVAFKILERIANESS